jgi:xanthine/CO dehydrogenase XdhC/CoxF family maturation factor
VTLKLSRRMSDKDLLDFIAERSSAGEPISIITRITGDGRRDKFVVAAGAAYEHPGNSVELPPEITRAALNLLAARKSTAIIEIPSEPDDRVTYVLDAIRPKPSLVIYGAGHVGQALATIGALVGYEVTVVDDREEFLSRSRLPDHRIKLLRSGFSEAVRDISVTSNTAIVIVTRGHQYDEICLRGAVGSKASYIGMIGSRRRVISVFKRLERDGVAPSELERIHAPIGLAIGAVSPQEIAVAIMAEVISVLNPERVPKEK